MKKLTLLATGITLALSASVFAEQPTVVTSDLVTYLNNYQAPKADDPLKPDYAKQDVIEAQLHTAAASLKVALQDAKNLELIGNISYPVGFLTPTLNDASELSDTWNAWINIAETGRDNNLINTVDSVILAGKAQDKKLSDLDTKIDTTKAEILASVGDSGVAHRAYINYEQLPKSFKYSGPGRQKATSEYPLLAYVVCYETPVPNYLMRAKTDNQVLCGFNLTMSAQFTSYVAWKGFNEKNSVAIGTTVTILEEGSVFNVLDPYFKSQGLRANERREFFLQTSNPYTYKGKSLAVNGLKTPAQAVSKTVTAPKVEVQEVDVNTPVVVDVSAITFTDIPLSTDSVNNGVSSVTEDGGVSGTAGGDNLTVFGNDNEINLQR